MRRHITPVPVGNDIFIRIHIGNLIVDLQLIQRDHTPRVFRRLDNDRSDIDNFHISGLGDDIRGISGNGRRDGNRRGVVERIEIDGIRLGTAVSDHNFFGGKFDEIGIGRERHPHIAFGGFAQGDFKCLGDIITFRNGQDSGIGIRTDERDLHGRIRSGSDHHSLGNIVDTPIRRLAFRMP